VKSFTLNVSVCKKIVRRTKHFFLNINSPLLCSLLIKDELIRQVTINCAERGLLLLRVRDEIRMTIAAYQTLYESSIAFGMRKALMAEQKKAEMEAKVHPPPLLLSNKWKTNCELPVLFMCVGVFIKIGFEI
jgi:hypothetical protein